MGFEVKTGIHIDFKINMSPIDKAILKVSRLEKKVSLFSKKKIRLSVDTKGINSGFSRLNKELNKSSRHLTDIAKKTKLVGVEFDRAGRSSDRFGRDVDDSSTRSRKSMLGLKTAIAGVVSSLSIKKFVSISDEYTNLDNRIKLLTNTEKELIDVRKKILSISNNTRTLMKDSIPLYYTLTTSTEKLGLAEAKRLELLQTINKFNKIGGTSEQSISAAITQLNQGLSSGVLRGEELNSILEQTPRLAKAIADGLSDISGVSVGIGDLKKLGEAGVLTTDKITRAILSQTQKANSEFKKLSTTVGQAGTVMSNSIMETIGFMNKELGITDEISRRITSLSKIILSNKEEITSYIVGIKNSFIDLIPFIKAIGIGVASIKLAKLAKSLFDFTKNAKQSFGKVVSYIKEIGVMKLDWMKILDISSLAISLGVIYGELGELGAKNVAMTHNVAGRNTKSLDRLLSIQKGLQDRIENASNASIIDKLMSDDYRRVDDLKNQLNAINRTIDSINKNKVTVSIDDSKLRKTTSALDTYYKTLAKVESNNNYNSTQGNKGSYRGKYQFNEKSATEFLNKIGKSWDDYLKNPSVQEKVVRMETERNTKILEQFKVPLSEFSLFVAHNIGATGAGRVLTNKPIRSDISHIQNQAGMNSKSTVEDYISKYSKIFDTKIIEINKIADTATKSILVDKEIQKVLNKTSSSSNKKSLKLAQDRVKKELESFRITQKQKLLHEQISIESKKYGDDRLAQLRRYVSEDKARIKYEEALLKKGVSKNDLSLLEAKKKLIVDQRRLVSEAEKVELKGIDSSVSKMGSKIDSLVSKLGEGIRSSIQPLLDAFGLDGKGIMDSISSLFGGGDDIGSMFSGFLSDFTGTALGSIMDGMGLNSVQSSLMTSGSPYAIAIAEIGKLFSSTVSEAEVERAKGRKEFGGVPLSDLKNMYSEALSPSVTIARSQLKLLEDLNTSFKSFDFSGDGIGGTSIDGSNFKPKETDVLGGLYSSSTTLLGAGVEAEAQKLSDFLVSTNVNLYKSTLEKTSALFGLITNESVNTETTDAPPKLKALIKYSVENRIQSAVDSLDAINIDTTNFEKSMKEQIFELGKVDFSDLSQDEKSQALQQAIAESTNKMIQGALGQSNEYLVTQLEGFSIAGEDIGDTLGRVALDFQAVKGQMGLFGVEINNLVESEAIIKASGGLQQFSQGMATFRSSFFTPEEQRAMNQVELETALMKYNVVIPANKEEFKQLVITTAQKIKTLKTDIEIRKAQLRAEINGTKLEIELKKAGLEANAKISKMGIEISSHATMAEVQGKISGAKAIQEVTKGRIKVDGKLVDSMNAVGGASVTFGNNLHKTIKAISKGSAKAIKAQKGKDGKGEVNYDAIGDKALQQMEAELSKLEGLYGSLMGNMSGFADFYGATGNMGSGSVGSVGNALNNTKQTAKQATDEILEFNKTVSSSAMSLGLAGKNLLTVSMNFDDTADSVVESVQKLSQALKTLGKNTDNTYTKQMQVLQMQEGAGGESALNSALDLYRKTFFTKEQLLFDEKAVLLKQYREIGINEIPNTKEDLKKIIDSFGRGTPKLDYNFGKLLSLTGSFLNLQKEIEKTTKELDGLKDKSREVVLNFGKMSSKDLLSSMKNDLSNEDWKSAGKSFNDFVKSVKEENITTKEKVFKIAEANNIIQNSEVKKESTVDEMKKLNKKVDDLLAIERSVNTHVAKVSENGDQLYINGSCASSQSCGSRSCG